MKTKEDASSSGEWDFSIVSGWIESVSVIYIIQCVRLHHMPLDTRNRLTMIIWWSLLLNLIALQLENCILLALNLNV